MSQYISKYVVCPYYHRHDDNRICCEGTSSRNTINLVFSDSKKLKEYTEKYCENMDNYERCMICQALNTKYGVLNKL